MTATEASARTVISRALLIMAALTAALLLLPAARAQADFTFSEPSVRATGPEQMVFDYSTSACEEIDIPDSPARAFRDSFGRVQLIDSHYTARRNIGTNLDNVTHDCAPVMSSSENQDPSTYNDHEWLSTPYALDPGTTVYALVSDEYQGWRYPTRCTGGDTWPEQQTCWENSLTLAKSTNAGDSYSQATPPGHLVAAVPYQYSPGSGPYGFFSPSNIVQKDGYYYALIRVEPIQAQAGGACLIRTNDLSNPTSWRAWNGSDFTVSFIDPYTTSDDPAAHVCTPVSVAEIAKMTSSLTYSTYFQKYILVGQLAPKDPVTHQPVPGFYYSLSDDLVHWSQAKLLVQTELDWTYECGDPGLPVRDPSLIDPRSATRNFETTGQHPYLYFTRFNYEFFADGGCSQTFDRDLIRIPIEFSDATGHPDPPAPPSPPTSPPPAPPAGTQASAVSPSCSSARVQRKRLVRLVSKTRRKLAHAHSKQARRRYRKQLRAYKKLLEVARESVNVKCASAG